MIRRHGERVFVVALTLIAVVTLVGLLFVLNRPRNRYDYQLGDGCLLPRRSDPHVEDMAEFAMAEYNKQFDGEEERTKKSVSGHLTRMKIQIVAPGGIKYTFQIVDRHHPVVMFYEAVVIEMNWLNYRKLVYFKKLRRGFFNQLVTDVNWD
ncbi:hypothetical protein FF1_043073 [Malus domestica]